MGAQPKQIAEGVYWLPLSIANVYFVRSGDTWSLVDTAVPGNGKRIAAAAETLFGRNAAPASILLTHAHLDHSGSALDLAHRWRLPVYLDSEEVPFVDGITRYPPPDPSVGGFMAAMSRVLPRRPVNLEDTARPIERNAPPPGLPDWRCIFTPGHSPGHIAFYRGDGVVLAGDACTTVNLDSLWDFLRKRQEICRPPAPVTCNWPAAKESLARLAALEPRVLACGHGVPMNGPDTAALLRQFSSRFQIPSRGRYVSG